MSQADTNGNNIGFNFTGTGAIPQTVNIITDGSPPDINLKNAAGTAVTLDSNNMLNVSTKYVGGTLQTARDLGQGIPNAVAGAAGGLLIAGTNAATTFSGTAASGATPAVAGLTITGGAASTTGGGVSAPAVSLTGGAGAASTNGASAGITSIGGGTTTVSGGDGATFTATGNKNGVTFAKSGSGQDLNATSTPLTLAKTTNITGFNDIAAPSGFAAATFPSGTIANTTNITAGTITTVTNLTNAPTAGDFTSTMKTSLNNATPTVTTGTISSGAINAASINADTGLILRANTATNSSASTLVLDASASATDSFYVNDWLVVTSGTGVGQVRRISAYTGSSKTATVSPNWTTTPATNGTFTILPAARVDIAAILGTASAGAAGSVGIDWAQVSNPSSTVNLSATTTNVVNTASALTTNNDKTGYSLTQTFPTNFSSLGISASGHISNVDTLTTYTGNTVQTGDAYARLGAPAGASTAADIAAVKTDTAAVKTQTDKMAFTVANQIDANVITKTGFSLTSAYDPAKTAAQAGDAMTLTAAYDAAKTAASATTAAAIKAKTDSLTFTVSGQVDSNIQYVNDAAITGNGQSGTEWGPA